jgi:hypothetical protein
MANSILCRKNSTRSARILNQRSPRLGNSRLKIPRANLLARVVRLPFGFPKRLHSPQTFPNFPSNVGESTIDRRSTIVISRNFAQQNHLLSFSLSERNVMKRIFEHRKRPSRHLLLSQGDTIEDTVISFAERLSADFQPIALV